MERIFSSHFKFLTTLCFFILCLVLALFFSVSFLLSQIWSPSLCLYLFFLWYFVKKYQLWTEFFQYPSGYWACDFQYPNLKSGIAVISGYRYHKFEALTGLIFVNKCFSLTWSWVQQQLQHSTAEWRRKRSVVLYVAKMKREGQMLLPLKISLWFFCRTSYHNQLEMV
jgi:hypothetical protein